MAMRLIEQPSPLPVTKGGTGTTTPLTVGSIVFAGTGGVLSQNNSQLSWDNLTSTLYVRGSQARLPNGSVLAGQKPGITFDSYGDTGLGANGDNIAIWESGVIALNLTSLLREFRVPSNFTYAFSSSISNNTPADTSFYRHIAGVLRTAGGFIADGNVGIGGVINPTAKLHLGAVGSTPNTASLKIGGGTLLTTPEDGAIEYNSTRLYFTVGSTRYPLDRQTGIPTTASLNFGTILANSSASLPITVTGAAVGDVVLVGAPADFPANSCGFNAVVTATNTVTIFVRNTTTSSVVIPTGTWKVSVIQY